jgi:hypothetical protein
MLLLRTLFSSIFHAAFLLCPICIWQVTEHNKLEPAVFVMYPHKIKMHVFVLHKYIKHLLKTKHQTPNQMTLRYSLRPADLLTESGTRVQN